jgi:hypothetical protein
MIPQDFPSCCYSSMRSLAVLVIHLIATLAQLLGPGGVRSLVAASPETTAPDRESLPATIAQSIRGGPHPGRPAGALGASNPSSSFRNCTEALDTARASQSLVEEVIQLSERHSSARDACARPAWPKVISIFLGE